MSGHERMCKRERERGRDTEQEIQVSEKVSAQEVGKEHMNKVCWKEIV